MAKVLQINETEAVLKVPQEIDRSSTRRLGEIKVQNTRRNLGSRQMLIERTVTMKKRAKVESSIRNR